MEQCRATAICAPGDVIAGAAPTSLESAFIEFFQQGQAEERRRITREIHDSTMQLLSCLGLALTRLKLPEAAAQSPEIIAEMENLLSEAQSELRTLSYLANPPPLEALGLHDALKALLHGFGRRSGLRPSLLWAGDRAPVEHPTEIALYRVVQEALSNVHRHARAVHVAVTVSHSGDVTEVRIRDDGLGIPPHPAYGVGLSGMRARLEEVGGSLTIRSISPGTEVVAMVPSQRLRQRPMPDSRNRLLQICANCHRTADRADARIAAELRQMASEFDLIADCLRVADSLDPDPPARFVPALPLRPDHNRV